MKKDPLASAQLKIATVVWSQRNKLAMTQQQLADKSGVGQRTVQRIEAAELVADLSTLIKICRVLDVRIELIADGQGVDL